MKVLFFLITLTGVIYLTVSSGAWFDFSAAPKNTVTAATDSSPIAAQVGTASRLEHLKKSVEELQQEQKNLKASLDYLRDTTDSVAKNKSKKQVDSNSEALKHNAVSPIKESEAVFKALESPKGIELDATQEQRLKIPRAANQTNVGIVNEASTEELPPAHSYGSSEQQKRVEQQAQLRDIASRRQFAALEALQSRR